MRLLHVVPTYLPATRYGGPIYSVHGLCKALTAHGHEVYVFTTKVDGPGDSAVPLGQPVDNAETVTVKRPGIGISPMRWDDALGRVALRDFAPDELIEV